MDYSKSFRPYKFSENEYVKMRKLYYKEVHGYFDKNKSQDIKELTHEELFKIIKDVKASEVLRKNGCKLSPSQCSNISKYEVIRNPSEVLILRRSKPEDPQVKVPASDSIFNLLLYAHIDTNHGSEIQIAQELSTKCEIPKIYYEIFTRDVYCPECRKAKFLIPKKFGDCGLAVIINMMPTSDEKFNFILYYIDKATNYTLLRPLVLGNEIEIAMELLKIFLDFGAPKVLQCVNVKFFMKVIQSVSKVYPGFDIVVSAIVTNPNEIVNNVTNLVYAWIKNASCDAWSTGIYMIQWELNNTNNANLPTSFSKVFQSRTSSCDLPTQASKKVETETFRPIENSDMNSNGNFNRIKLQETSKIISLSQNNCKAKSIPKDMMDKILEEQRVTLMTPTTVPTLNSGVENNSNTIEQQVLKTPISVQSNLHTEEDLGIVIKSEEDLEELPTISTESHDSQPILLNFSNNLKERSIKSECVEEISGMSNDAAKSVGSQTVSKICHVCHKMVLRSYACDKCKNEVHLHCTQTHVTSGDISNNANLALVIICVSCSKHGAGHNEGIENLN